MCMSCNKSKANPNGQAKTYTPVNTSRPTGTRSITTNGTPKVKVSFGNRNR